MFTPEQVKTLVEANRNYTLVDLGSSNCPIFDLHKLNEKIINNENKYITSNDEDSKRRVVSASWADAKLIQMENGSQIIKLSHDHSVTNSVEVDTSKRPVTTRTRKAAKPNVSIQDLKEVNYHRLFEKNLTVPAKLVKGLLTLVDKGQISNRHHGFFHSLEPGCGEEESDE